MALGILTTITGTTASGKHNRSPGKKRKQGKKSRSRVIYHVWSWFLDVCLEHVCASRVGRTVGMAIRFLHPPSRTLSCRYGLKDVRPYTLGDIDGDPKQQQQHMVAKEPVPVPSPVRAKFHFWKGTARTHITFERGAVLGGPPANLAGSPNPS